MRDERIEGAREKPGSELPAAAGTEASPLREYSRSLHALDAGSLGMIWTLWQVGVDVLAFITTDTLLILDRVDAFEGLFGMFARNLARPRVWLPRLEPLVITEQGVN